MTPPHNDGPPSGLGGRLEPICASFESEWLADHRPRLEEFLPRVAEPDRPALLRELLILDLHYRSRHGEKPSAEEYAARLPRYAALVQGHFAPLSTKTNAPTPPPPDSAAPTRQAQAAAPGYVFLDVLGEGGMGRVYKAHQTRLDRLVAVKVIRPDRLSDPEAVERFHKEAHAAARVHHPNIVAVHDAGEHQGTHFLVMEYVRGVSLHRLVADKGPLTVSRACDYGRQAALGLAYAHRLGLVHRDVKPSNLILGDDGVVKLTDFGLVRCTALEAEATALTATGDLMGTPDFVAPEQVRDPRAVDGRADVYSLGCTLFTLLAGRPPFQVITAGQKLAAHLEREPPRLDAVRAGVPAALAAVVARMMAKKPDDRFANADEAAAALEPFVGARASVPSPRRRSRMRRWPWLVGAAALLLAGAAAATAFILPRLWSAPIARPPGPPAVPVVQAPKDRPDATIPPPKPPVGIAPDGPPPTGGELVFQQNFDGHGAFLPRQESSNGKEYFTTDRYVTELPVGGWIGRSFNYGPPLWDFVVEVQFELEGGELESVFRERINEKSRTRIVLRVNPTGAVVLKREFSAFDGNSIRPTDMKNLLAGAPAAAPLDEAPKSLRVVALGETVEVWLNGKRIAQGRDAYQPDPNTIGNPNGLSVGVWRSDEFATAKLSLARLRIWKLAPAADKTGP